MKNQKPAKQTKKIVTAKKPVAKKPVVAKAKAAKKVLSKKVTPVVAPAKTAAKKTRDFVLKPRVVSKREKMRDAAKTRRRRARRVVTPVFATVEEAIPLANRVNDLKKRWGESADPADKKAWKDAVKELARECKFSGGRAKMATPTLPPAEEWPGGRPSGDGSMPFFVRGITTPERNALVNLALAEGFKPADLLKGYSYPRSCFTGDGSLIPLIERVGIALRYGDDRKLDEAVQKVARTLFPGRFSLHRMERDENFGVARPADGKPRAKRAGRQLSAREVAKNERARQRAEKEKVRLEFLVGGATAPKKVFSAKPAGGFRPKNDFGSEKMRVFRAFVPARLENGGNGNGNGGGIKLAAPVPVQATPTPAPEAKPATPRVELKKYEHAATHCACCGKGLTEKESGRSDFFFKVYTHPVHKALPAFVSGEGAEVVNEDRNTARRLCRECGVMINRASENETTDQLCMLVKMVNSRGSNYAKAQLIAIAVRYREDFALAYAKARTMAAVLAVA